MTKPFILGLGGTSRNPSFSGSGLHAALNFAAEAGADTYCIDIRDLKLPLYQADWALSDYPEAQAIAEFIELHRRADACIWSSPCYHGTVTGVFKNAIDFLEFLEDDERVYLTGRAVGLISVNDITPIETMRTIARELRAWVCPSKAVLQEEDFAEDGSINSEIALRRLKRISSELMTFVQAMRPR